MTAPFLVMHGTADPTVGFINGLAFYHALRYNGKKAVLLAYPNEGHGLRGLAPKWLTEGMPYLKKGAGAGQ